MTTESTQKLSLILLPGEEIGNELGNSPDLPDLIQLDVGFDILNRVIAACRLGLLHGGAAMQFEVADLLSLNADGEEVNGEFEMAGKLGLQPDVDEKGNLSLHCKLLVLDTESGEERCLCEFHIDNKRYRQAFGCDMPGTPRMVVYMDGGLVQTVYSELPCQVLVADADTEGVDEDEVFGVRGAEYCGHIEAAIEDVEAVRDYFKTYEKKVGFNVHRSITFKEKS